MFKDIRTYRDLTKFIGNLPSSAPPGGMSPKYLHSGNPKDPAIQRAIHAEDAMYVFAKYKMSPADKLRLIYAILNIKDIDND